MNKMCCASCRVLQPPAGACRLCAHHLVQLSELRHVRVQSVAIIPKDAPIGWRDRLELLATAFGMIVGSTVTGLLTGSGLATLLVFAGVAAFGSYQQRARPVLVRRPRLEGADVPGRPPGAPLRGVAIQHDRTLPDPGGPALVITTTIWLDRRVLLRDIQACSFWLEVEARRLFVEPPLWLEAQEAALLDVEAALSDIGARHLPIDNQQRRELTATRGVMRSGDVLTALGAIVDEHRPELGSYRDATFGVMKPNGRAPLWLEPAPGL